MNTLNVRLIPEKALWEITVLSHPESNFLQSWNWGKFHKKLGKHVYRLGLFDQEKVIGCAQCIVEKARRGTYVTVAGGPLISWNDNQHTKLIFSEIKNIARQEHCSFIRIRPQILDTPENELLIKGLGFIPSPMHVTADLTLQLDLSKSEETLLANMRKSTRYEIRKAKKLEIYVKQSTNSEEIQEFYDYQYKLSQKHHFISFSYEYLLKQFESFLVDNQVYLYHSFSKDHQLLASAFIIFYNKEAVYHYGISTPENDRMPGAYACQWKVIREAKKRGMKTYNFWGVAPEDQPDHRFAGVSIFKRGFGGEEVAYLPAHDLPLSPRYYLIKGFEEVRRKMRKL